MVKQKRARGTSPPSDIIEEDEDSFFEVSKIDVESHREMLERTCPIDESCMEGLEVSVSEMEEEMTMNGLGRIMVVRGKEGGKADEDLYISYPRAMSSLSSMKRFIDPSMQIPTIQVDTQDEGPSWSMKDICAYFETPKKNRKHLLNIVSFNLALTGLDGHIMPPACIRDLDLVGRAWPSQSSTIFQHACVSNPFASIEELDKIDLEAYSPPQTLTYLLLGPEGAYTDWHVDMGGSSVWYHVVTGQKTFMAAPDTSHNVTEFLKWSSSTKDQSTFLGQRLEKCVRLELHAGDTLFLPGGWFHAVSTPKDTIVLGGNYINPLRLENALHVVMMEQKLRVGADAKYPKYDMLMYYAACDFVNRLVRGRNLLQSRGRSHKDLKKSLSISELEVQGLPYLEKYLSAQLDHLKKKRKRLLKTKSRHKYALIQWRCKELKTVVDFLRTEIKALDILPMPLVEKDTQQPAPVAPSTGSKCTKRPNRSIDGQFKESDNSPAAKSARVKEIGVLCCENGNRVEHDPGQDMNQVKEPEVIVFRAPDDDESQTINHFEKEGDSSIVIHSEESSLDDDEENEDEDTGDSAPESREHASRDDHKPQLGNQAGQSSKDKGFFPRYNKEDTAKMTEVDKIRLNALHKHALSAPNLLKQPSSLPPPPSHNHHHEIDQQIKRRLKDLELLAEKIGRENRLLKALESGSLQVPDHGRKVEAKIKELAIKLNQESQEFNAFIGKNEQIRERARLLAPRFNSLQQVLDSNGNITLDLSKSNQGNNMERRPRTDALKNVLVENQRKRGSQQLSKRVGGLTFERYGGRHAYEDSRHPHRHAYGPQSYNKFATGRYSPRKGIRGRYTSQSKDKYHSRDEHRDNLHGYNNSNAQRRTDVNESSRVASPITSAIQDSRHLQAALKILRDEKRWLTPRDIAILSIEKFLIPFTPDLERLLSQELEHELAQTNSRVSRQNSRFGLRKWI